jgi:CheY-like chemotaxis protein
MNLMALEGILCGLNCKVHACNSSVDALAVFKQRLLSKCCSSKFDLVLTDIQMPDLDGF